MIAYRQMGEFASTVGVLGKTPAKHLTMGIPNRNTSDVIGKRSSRVLFPFLIQSLRQAL